MATGRFGIKEVLVQVVGRKWASCLSVLEGEDKGKGTLVPVGLQH